MTLKTHPQSARKVLDNYFLENRARLLEIAAFLDRIDRAAGSEEAKTDFRYRSFRYGIKLLGKRESDRAKMLQLTLSDLSREPLESARGSTAACGARKEFHEDH